VAANSIFDWEGIRQYSTVNLGVAVDTGAALVVPVVKHADAMSLPQLSAATTALVAKARAGAMAVNDMADGTFTVTNLGMFGVHWFTPVLNTPQSCILGVGAIHQPSSAVPALLPLSFTFDHRALDGAEAARSLAAISEAIENIDVISSILPKTGQDYSS
jgi:pyruvate dehydrogenase E2 component (dihydrolipoamide acetyltransferase)